MTMSRLGSNRATTGADGECFFDSGKGLLVWFSSHPLVPFISNSLSGYMISARLGETCPSDWPLPESTAYPQHLLAPSLSGWPCLLLSMLNSFIAFWQHLQPLPSSSGPTGKGITSIRNYVISFSVNSQAVLDSSTHCVLSHWMSLVIHEHSCLCAVVLFFLIHGWEEWHVSRPT